MVEPSAFEQVLKRERVPVLASLGGALAVS